MQFWGQQPHKEIEHVTVEWTKPQRFQLTRGTLNSKTGTAEILNAGNGSWFGK